MRILAIDIGMGTQDIMIYERGKPLESAFKLVLPSPTSMYADIVRRSDDDLVIYGDTMGGGPISRALIAHVREKRKKVYMTEDAARTIRDDLNVVRAYGIEIISDDEVDEVARMMGAKKMRISDLNNEILRFLCRVGVIARGIEDFDIVAIAVQDHGVAPPGVSDREHRFRLLAEKIGCALEDFAYLNDVPASLSRMSAVLRAVRRLDEDANVLLMDTGPAAALGAMEDEHVSGDAICVNVGNAHTVAFLIYDEIVHGIFEHHTHLLNSDKLREYLRKLADATITHDEVFSDGGHGAVVMSDGRGMRRDLPTVLTGPRRSEMMGIGVFAAPAGDMMMTGAVGLVNAALRYL